MIPITLQIKNFLSYGDELQTINFEPYHLVCLSGKNGHGKSALLDAITWALWGQARKVSSTAKADQGLLRLGQTHMLVILDFECNNIHYRIRREFAFTHGKPYAALDFGIVDAEHDTILPLTEKTIRGTQEKIERTILLDYETFINSAFLRQGSANEFSKKSPKDRKEILANILGLQRYEQLKKLASDTVRTQTTHKQQLLAIQTKIEADLLHRPNIEKNRADTQQLLKEHALQQKELASMQKDLQQQHTALIALKHMQEQHIKDNNALTVEYNELTAELKTSYAQWRTIHKKMLHLNSYEELKKQKNELCMQLAHTQKQLQLKLEKQEAYVKAQQSMVLLEQQLQQEHMQALQQQTTLQQYAQLQRNQTHQKIALCQQQLQETHKEIEAIQLRSTTLEQNIQKNSISGLANIEHCFDKRRTYYQRWIAQANYIKNEYDQTEQKKILVDDTSSPCCPLCEQNLSATRKKFLKQKLSKNTLTLGHRYQRLKQLINNLKQILITQHTQLTALKQQQNTLIVDAQQIQHCQQQINECTAKQTKLLDQLAQLQQEFTAQEAAVKACDATLSTTTAQSRKVLQEHPVYKQRQLELQTLKIAYESIIYDQAEHIRLQELLHTVEQQLTQHAHIQQEIMLQDERKKCISTLCLRIKKIKLKRISLDLRSKDFIGSADLEKAYASNEVALTHKTTSWNKKNEQLQQDLGRFEQQLAHLDTLQREHTEQQKHIAALTQEIDDYQEIAQAMSKNGIQALLIEDAIPEIEQEANELLSKLTDNQATILIESLRDLKKGGTKETLDINIADAIGIRPYELFSGGEAFRIDFSLRVAISKLLARRAGTSLQTLIIDEGFGSQDDEGLSYIMDALYKIQDDFKKIIIVSHLPRLKDQFPVHFHIHKNPHGSTVNIIEQA